MWPVLRRVLVVMLGVQCWCMAERGDVRPMLRRSSVRMMRGVARHTSAGIRRHGSVPVLASWHGISCAFGVMQMVE